MFDKLPYELFGPQFEFKLTKLQEEEIELGEEEVTFTEKKEDKPVQDFDDLFGAVQSNPV